MNNESILNKDFPFSTVMPVRITDVNYGNHLGHTATIGMFHNTRVLFLDHYEFNEMNIEGNGLIMLNSKYLFIKESFFNAVLTVKVGIGEFSKSRFSFIYKATDQTGADVAHGKEEFACFNYDKRKIVKIPSLFLEFCEKSLVQIETRII